MNIVQETLNGPLRVVILLGRNLGYATAAVRMFNPPDRRFVMMLGDGLHPSLHAAECKELDGQRVVITTHSPHIVGYFEDPSEVMILRHNDKDSPYRESQGEWTPLLPAVGMNALQILTGSWFDMGTTLGPATLQMMHDHRMLLRDPYDPEKREKRLTLEELLRERLGRYADTSVEEFVMAMAAELEEDPGFANLSNKQVRELRERTMASIRGELPKLQGEGVLINWQDIPKGSLCTDDEGHWLIRWPLRNEKDLDLAWFTEEHKENGDVDAALDPDYCFMPGFPIPAYMRKVRLLRMGLTFDQIRTFFTAPRIEGESPSSAFHRLFPM